MNCSQCGGARQARVVAVRRPIVVAAYAVGLLLDAHPTLSFPLSV